MSKPGLIFIAFLIFQLEYKNSLFFLSLLKQTFLISNLFNAYINCKIFANLKT